VSRKIDDTVSRGCREKKNKQVQTSMPNAESGKNRGVSQFKVETTHTGKRKWRTTTERSFMHGKKSPKTAKTGQKKNAISYIKTGKESQNYRVASTSTRWLKKSQINDRKA